MMLTVLACTASPITWSGWSRQSTKLLSLIADPKTDEGKARMKTMVATDDGFGR